MLSIQCTRATDLYSANLAPKAVTIASIASMKKENEKMKILDDTIHSLKISNSQNLEDFKLAESNITSAHQRTCWRIELFHFKFQRKKKNIKMTSFLKAQRPPEALTALGPAAAKIHLTRSEKHKGILKNT
ncbi:hypothetical protein AVEN_49042-1 [Araneus ventricosus]|uniref:Uncharacterized protein n=1 Tax=Araneus ventricosus TaxID=182803 RepID=A0A4Y2WFP0_ARAVE|nr:hypothetical protein AVEN_49042-1 [Araneus ventricosus]